MNRWIIQYRYITGNIDNYTTCGMYETREEMLDTIDPTCESMTATFKVIEKK